MSSSRDICENIIIPITKILKYFANSKRPVREGEAIVNAGWIRAIGIETNSKHRSPVIIGNVVQASALSLRPHEVKILNIEKPVSLWKFSCSCKAGEGAKCKHIAACLLFIYRNPELRGVSCTELRQKWGKVGPAFPKKYSGVMTSDMCHIRKKQKNYDFVTNQQVDEFRLQFIEAQPDSEVAKLTNGMRSVPPVPTNNDDCIELYYNLVNHDGLKEFIPLMESFIESNPTAPFNTIKKSVNEAVAICKSTIEQTSAKWLLERKCRITGSVSYRLFTYGSNKNQNWNKKLNSIYNSSFKGNKATRYGTYAEKLAKQVYGHNYLLFDCGLIISPDLPFLAVSPDGISFNGDSWNLVEIKSPVNGRARSAEELIETKMLPYIIIGADGEYKLNERHPYYGQIQLGLAVTNLHICDLVIYSKFNNSFVIIKVIKNEIFLKRYVEELTKIYFNFVMPFIFQK